MIIEDMYGEKHEATLINSPDSPYLKYEYKVVQKCYNPNYGDDRICTCGHTYIRHFDSYENMTATGCKYCNCAEFVEKTKNEKEPPVE